MEGCMRDSIIRHFPLVRSDGARAGAGGGLPRERRAEGEGEGAPQELPRAMQACPASLTIASGGGASQPRLAFRGILYGEPLHGGIQ